MLPRILLKSLREVEFGVLNGLLIDQIVIGEAVSAPEALDPPCLHYHRNQSGRALTSRLLSDSKQAMFMSLLFLCGPLIIDRTLRGIKQNYTERMIQKECSKNM